MDKLFPQNVSTYGSEIDALFFTITLFIGIAFVVSLFLLVYPLFRYRYKEGRRASRNRGEAPGQMKWIYLSMGLLACCDFFMLYQEHGTWVKMEETLPEEVDFHVAITGRQWNWMFTYPGPDNKLYTGDDVFVNQQDSELHVPVNKNIIIDLKAVDVIHSFFVREIRLKQDAIPGRTITRWFNVTEEGRYDIACAEICGVLHSMMRNYLVVESQEAFEKYLEELYASSQQ